MDYTVSVTDASKIDGINSACSQYNAANDTELTPRDYVEFIVNSAAESYAKQILVLDDKDAAIAVAAKLIAEKDVIIADQKAQLEAKVDAGAAKLTL